MIKKTISLSFVAIFFTSCVSLAPDLKIENESLIPNQFKNSNNSETLNDTKPRLEEFIKDETLKKVVNLAIENNKDIKIALLNIDAAKALYRVEESQYYPDLNANASFTREQKINNTIGNTYKVGIGTSFELDLFGKIKSLNDNALNTFLATKYASDATKLSLVSQTIVSWLRLASNLENLKLSKEINKNLEDVYNLINKKYLAGINSKEDVLASFAMLKESQNEILNFENQVQKDINALELILSSKLDISLFPKDFKNHEDYLLLVKSSINSNVLLSRPDIVELEYKLRAKNANIGAARAAFFPSISLTASTGFASPNLSSLFTSATNIWQFSPSINIPIFNAGENSAKLDFSKAQKDIALNEYEKGIQTAFKEVNDALIIRKNISQKQKNQEEMIEALKQTYNISLNSYKIGYGTYINMLISQRAYINSQKNLIKVYLEELENKVDLYKALGGNLS